MIQRRLGYCSKVTQLLFVIPGRKRKIIQRTVLSGMLIILCVSHSRCGTWNGSAAVFPKPVPSSPIPLPTTGHFMPSQCLLLWSPGHWALIALPRQTIRSGRAYSHPRRKALPQIPRKKPWNAMRHGQRFSSVLIWLGLAQVERNFITFHLQSSPFHPRLARSINSFRPPSRWRPPRRRPSGHTGRCFVHVS